MFGDRKLLTILAALAGVQAAAWAQSLAETPSKARAADGRYISWREHIIDDQALSGIPLRGGDGLDVADLDGDRYPDVVSVHEDSYHIRIAFGSKDPQRWESHTLADGTMARQAEDCHIGDVNGDGRLDIVAACERKHLIYFEAPKNPRDMSAWTPVILEATRDRGSWIRVKIADVDGDGRMDIVGANKGRTSFSVFYCEGKTTDPEAWKETVIGQCNTPINLHPIDMDGDGDLDMVAGSRGERKIYVYENLGRGRKWKEILIHSGQPDASGFMMEFADLNGDGRIDIVTQVSGGGIIWFEHPAEWSARWPIHEIGTVAPDHATGLKLVDINGDGRLDLFTGGYSDDPRKREPENISPHDSCGRLAWFEQPADPKAPWIRHDISRRRRGMFDAFVPVDINRDGLIDFVATRGNSGEYDGVLWLEQVRTDKPERAFRQAREKDSPEVPLP
ncbi:MAG TPA: VCBS repeat-containing protein [Phycisphaerae bacterium]|nr:VCBS repeat-containing protein [Phycisphaerae bacterium]HOM50468.1 VCBS repeat-containing protein [Phycisphaerae bacterium]HON66528.1 VCBS repeat-containing protein [Phycisphaerae bacterium]HPP28169.1 VCBS repeat-containing protein [Phycisphaerae bacterium]